MAKRNKLNLCYNRSGTTVGAGLCFIIIIIILGQFCDVVAKVVMFTYRFSQNWLQAKFESRFLIVSFYVFGYIHEPCKEI
jgi:hypothetical protein